MIENLILKLFRKKIIKNFKQDCPKKSGHALLYYKTDPFILRSLAKEYTHTNHWEILEITKILNRLGYWVDILDRNISLRDVSSLENKYDLFIGLGAGNSGKYFAQIGEKLTKAIRVFYAAGPEPEESNRLIKERYAYFQKRHPNANMALRRIIDKVDIGYAMRHTDVIFSIGNKFSIDTYKKYEKPLYRINPSTSPKIHTSLDALKNKKSTSFLYFGGNGNIVKGLDILIEVFSVLPELTLYVCAPQEPDLDAIYKETLKKNKNIHYKGFIPIAGKCFDELTSECGYIILPSCSEGIATSVVTCMRRGLIPIVTYESGIDIGDFGFEIKDLDIEILRKQIQEITNMPESEFKQRIILSYISSFLYTQAGFSEAFEKSIISVLNNKL